MGDGLERGHGRRIVVSIGAAGAPRPLPGGSIVQRQNACSFPDGERILIGGGEAVRPLRLFVQDLAGGPPRAISPEGVRMPFGDVCISPGGSRIVAAAEEGPVLVLAAG